MLSPLRRKVRLASPIPISKCLATLCLFSTAPTAMPIAAQRRTPAHDGLLVAAQVAFGGGQQILAFAGAFFGQERVAADDQALAGELLGCRDLGEIALI